MGENLVIVESPAKAKTIGKFLGDGFTVKSSFGHIRDLPSNSLSVDLENGYEPQYLVSDDKKKIVAELKSLAKAASVVWLASDEDREGEAIAWHLREALKLDPAKTRRIVFHEITKEAIQHAVQNPRDIDMNLVMAQQARRVLDRIVGFQLSPLLWKKVRPKLSAGRVQSVAVRLIVDREREISAFSAKSQYKIEGIFNPEGSKSTVKVKAEIPERFESGQEAQSILEACREAHFHIGSVEEKDAKRNPSPPFTTSTLQQEASRKLGFSLSQTMRVAQTLYESGYITYMRTDSVNLSKLALGAAKQVITDMYGKEYSKTRQFATKTKGAQEAHEAIRPTYLANTEIEGGPQEKKLYALIWKRTVASQMAEATIGRTEITIESEKLSHKFLATADRIKFDGFLKVYAESSDDDQDEEETLLNLPELREGQLMHRQKVTATEKYTQKPPRYSEASLVKKLEELGIGRPSTYAPTISTIVQRGYVVKDTRPGTERQFNTYTLEKSDVKHTLHKEIWGSEKNKLFPEDIGMLVNDFLVDNFDTVVDFGFTAKVEEQFDTVAEGKLKWNVVIDDFFKPFSKKVEETLLGSRPSNAERVLGSDPATGKVVLVRLGRFGPLAQIGDSEDPEKRFVSLAKGQLLETITLAEALQLFALPRKVGEYNGHEIIASSGRFGPYVKYNGKFISIGKDLSPYTIDLETSVRIIEENSKKEEQRLIKSFEGEDIEILNGRFGAYIKKGKNNYKIPKGTDPASLELDAVKKIIEETPEKPRKKR
ncbi:MAG: type I DNA topoisomerase [Bacteroidetes bacterium HGW-Bacteroidetes-10]|jgi:DNA topoisomerase-1|nr:MAG: type I DNA topoisomerase [Bacteroidetes bacterium HGW-Bacteroidetes-10]